MDIFFLGTPQKICDGVVLRVSVNVVDNRKVVRIRDKRNRNKSMDIVHFSNAILSQTNYLMTRIKRSTF